MPVPILDSNVNEISQTFQMEHYKRYYTTCINRQLLCLDLWAGSEALTVLYGWSRIVGLILLVGVTVTVSRHSGEQALTFYVTGDISDCNNTLPTSKVWVKRGLRCRFIAPLVSSLFYRSVNENMEVLDSPISIYFNNINQIKVVLPVGDAPQFIISLHHAEAAKRLFLIIVGELI